MNPMEALKDRPSRAEFPTLDASTKVLVEYRYGAREHRSKMTLEALARALEHRDFLILNTWTEEGTWLVLVRCHRTKRLVGIGRGESYYIYWPRD